MVGKRIREARKAAQMTQEQLADAAGISRHRLTIIENGDGLNMTAYTAVQIAKVLRVSLDSLLFDEC